jgi:hypothetical protein
MADLTKSTICKARAIKITELSRPQKPLCRSIKLVDLQCNDESGNGLMVVFGDIFALFWYSFDVGWDGVIVGNGDVIDGTRIRYLGVPAPPRHRLFKRARDSYHLVENITEKKS